MLEQLTTLQAGERRVGVKQCAKAVKEGRVLSAFIAQDADPKLLAPFLELCEKQGVQVVSVSTMEELGKACGIAVGSAVAVRLK